MPGPRKKPPLKRVIRSSTAPARRLWGDSIRAVRIASGIHETGAKSSRSFKPPKFRSPKPSPGLGRRSSPGTGRVRRSR